MGMNKFWNEIILNIQKPVAHTQQQRINSFHTEPFLIVLIFFFLYCPGALGICLSLIWFCTVYDSPQLHPNLNEKERKTFTDDGSNFLIASASVVKQTPSSVWKFLSLVKVRSENFSIFLLICYS